jgi:RHS repeat-associated protein
MSKTNSSGVVYFFYDLEDVLLELNASGIQTANYTQGPGIDEPLGMTRNSGSYYYLPDGLGSIRGLVDNNQNIVANYQYDVFGSIRSMKSSVWNPYRFTAREWGADAELYYYRARYYDSEVGRFLSKDSAGFVDGPNLYLYVDNDPVNKVDPSGNIICCKRWSWWTCIRWGSYGIDKSYWLKCTPFVSLASGAGLACLLGVYACLVFLLWGFFGLIPFLACAAAACGAYAMVAFFCGLSAIRCY